MNSRLFSNPAHAGDEDALAIREAVGEGRDARGVASRDVEDGSRDRGHGCPVLPDADDAVAEFQHIGLHRREDERDQASLRERITNGTGEARPVTAHQSAFRANDEVLDQLGAACVFLQVGAAIEARREFSGGE
jgi:hypothetical protein